MADGLDRGEVACSKWQFRIGLDGGQELAGFRWTGKRTEAALLVAQDELSNEEIAKRAGITRQGLDKWKRAPEFQERVEELLAAMASR